MTKIYEDDLIIMSLAQEPMAVGHIIVEPKEKLPDLQSASDDLIKHLFFGASYAATALFELAQAQGTNIILEEHDLRINVIARAQDDGLDLMWTPSQVDQSELQSLSKSIKDDIDVALWKKDNPESKPVTAQKQTLKKSDDSSKINYLMKSMDRIP